MDFFNDALTYTLKHQSFSVLNLQIDFWLSQKKEVFVFQDEQKQQ